MDGIGGATLDALFRAHWPLVVGYLCRRTGDAALAEELAQETFYKATRAFVGWRGGSATAWLLAIARTTLVDEVRRGRRLVPLDDALAPATGSREDEVVAVRDVLDRLPAPQRRVLELVFVDGFSHAEVAAMTGTSAGAVKTAVYRARRAFAAAYQEGT